jgi:RNA polymerase sigma-70 factor (ECF subfamily)
MLSFLVRRTYDPEVAVDLVAETFAAAFEARGTFRGATDEEAAGWVYGIARNQLGAWYRRGDVERRALRRLGVERRPLNDDEVERIDDLAELAELRERVAVLMDELPADARAAVRLRVVGERSYREVATALGVSEDTARARVSRALRALAERLEADGAAAEVGSNG